MDKLQYLERQLKKDSARIDVHADGSVRYVCTERNVEILRWVADEFTEDASAVFGALNKAFGFEVAIVLWDEDEVFPCIEDVSNVSWGNGSKEIEWFVQ